MGPRLAVGLDSDPRVEAGPGLADYLSLDQPAYPLVLDQRGDRWYVLPGPEKPTRTATAWRSTSEPRRWWSVDRSEQRSIRNTASALNGQVRLGDNVLTRINLCMQKPELVKRLQHAVARNNIRPLLAELLAESNVAIEQVKCLGCRGQYTTMLHLLAGVDPSPLGTAPFTPVFLEHRVLTGRELALIPKSLRSHDPDRPLDHPARRSGSSPVARCGGLCGSRCDRGGVFHGHGLSRPPLSVGRCGHQRRDHPEAGDRFLGCATAAGPAFEGAGLTNGVRAGQGAISHIRLDRQTRNRRSR
jgi:hypothetical protein